MVRFDLDPDVVAVKRAPTFVVSTRGPRHVTSGHLLAGLLISAPLVHCTAHPHDGASVGIAVLDGSTGHPLRCRATFVSSDVLLTAGHCVAGHPRRLRIETPHGATVRALLAAQRHPMLDAVLLRVERDTERVPGSTRALASARRRPTVGQKVCVTRSGQIATYVIRKVMASTFQVRSDDRSDAKASDCLPRGASGTLITSCAAAGSHHGRRPTTAYGLLVRGSSGCGGRQTAVRMDVLAPWILSSLSAEAPPMSPAAPPVAPVFIPT